MPVHPKKGPLSINLAAPRNLSPLSCAIRPNENRDAYRLVRTRFAGAALLIALVAAPAALAQHASPDDPGELPVTMRFAPLGAPDPRSRPTSGIFPAQPGLGVSAQTYTEQDGSQVTRRGLVAGWSIQRNVEAGIGLFSVTDDRPKISETRRNWSVREVAPKNRNIAAVGVKVRF